MENETEAFDLKSKTFKRNIIIIKFKYQFLEEQKLLIVKEIGVGQLKRGGPITHMSEDRNLL